MKVKRSVSFYIYQVFNTIVLTLMALSCILPILHVFAMSLSSSSAAMAGRVGFVPVEFSLKAYEYLISKKDFFHSVSISLARVLVGTVFNMAIIAITAYPLSRSSRQFRARTAYMAYFAVTMFIGGGLIPTYLLMVRLGFMNTFWVYIIPSLFSAYYMLLTSSYIQGLPEALFESARIDGAGEITIFGKIVLPLSTPMLACIALYAGVGHWNSWFDVSLYSKNGTWDNLQIILYRLINQANALEKLMESQTSDVALRNIRPETMRAATTVVVVLPIVMVYPFLQKYFVSGITLGAVKG